jgi:hypothetical protein
MKRGLPWMLGVAAVLAHWREMPAADLRGLSAKLSMAETYSLGEPIVALFTIANAGQETVHLDLGANHKDNLVLLIKAPPGPRSAACLKEESYQVFDRFGAIGDIALKPGESFSESLVLNDWHCFDLVGDYELRVKLPLPPALAQAKPETLEASSRFRLNPFDRASLDAACRRLEETTISRDHPPAGAPPTSDEAARSAGHALSFVGDGACVPALLGVLQAGMLGRGDALQGLARIGTPSAMAAVVSVWDTLGRYDRQNALADFSGVNLGAQLRSALQRAGKAITAP